MSCHYTVEAKEIPLIFQTDQYRIVVRNTLIDMDGLELGNTIFI